MLDFEKPGSSTPRHEARENEKRKPAHEQRTKSSANKLLDSVKSTHAKTEHVLPNNVESIVDHCLYGVSTADDFGVPVCISRMKDTVFHLDDARSFLIAVRTADNQWTIREKFIYPSSGEEISDPLKASFSKMTAIDAVTDVQMLRWLNEFEKFGRLEERSPGDLEFREWAKINGYAPDAYGEFHRVSEGLPHHVRFSQVAVSSAALTRANDQTLARQQALIDPASYSSAPFQEGVVGWLKSQFVPNGRDIRGRYWKLYEDSWYPSYFVDHMEYYATHPYKALLFNQIIMEKGLERLLCVEDEKLFSRLEELVAADDHYAKAVRLILPQLLKKSFTEYPWDNGFKTCRNLNDFRKLPELNGIVGDEVRLQAIEFLVRNKPSDKGWMKAIASGMSDPKAGKTHIREMLAQEEERMQARHQSPANTNPSWPPRNIEAAAPSWPPQN